MIVCWVWMSLHDEPGSKAYVLQSLHYTAEEEILEGEVQASIRAKVKDDWRRTGWPA